MTGSTIITLFHNLTDDTLDSDFEYTLLNIAKNKIENKRKWEFLKKKGSPTPSATVVGGTYTTAYTLPTDYRKMVKVIDADGLEYKPIPFEEQINYKDYGNYYFIDKANSNLYLTGLIAESKTLYLIYIKKTDDITSDTSPVWDSDFHSLIAYEMAELYFGGLDIDAIEIQKLPKIRDEKKIIEDGMIEADDDAKLESLDHSRTPQGTDSSYRDDVVSGI